MIQQQGVIGQGIRYAVVGGMAAVVDIGLFAELYPGFIARLWLAATLSFLVAAVFNYTVSSLFVFRVGSLSSQRAVYFLMAATLGLLINVTVTAAVATGTGTEPVFAKFAGVGTAFLFNFMMNRHFVFGLPRRA